MHRIATIAIACALFVFSAKLTYAASPDEPKIAAFVHEYIRELSEQHDLRMDALAELRTDGKNSYSIMGTEINYGTRVQMALSSNHDFLSNMVLPPTFQKLRADLISNETMQSKIQGRIDDIASAEMSFLMDSRKPGVDYGRLAAKLPAFRAMLDKVENQYIYISTLIFLRLVDPKSHSGGHLNRLILTNRDCAAIHARLQADFGEKIFIKSKKDLFKSKYPFFNAAEAFSYGIFGDSYKCSSNS